jgi:hypothetical protein
MMREPFVNRCHPYRSVVLLFAVAAVWLGPPGGRMAAASPDSPAGDTAPDEPYIDGTYGFSLHPPRGWDIDRRSVPDETGLTIFQAVSPERGPRQHILTVRATLTRQPREVEDMLREITDSLTANLADVNLLESGTRTLAERQAGYFSATLRAGGAQQVLMACLVRARPRQFLLLTYHAPAEAREDAEKHFSEMLDGLRLLDDENSDETLREALTAGSEWLRGLNEERLNALDGNEQTLLIRLDKEPIGYVQSSVFVETYAGRRGVAIRERGWTLPADGTIRRVYNDLFVSVDRYAERWRLETLVLVPAQGGRSASLDRIIDEGVRESDQLLTSQQHGYDAASESNPPMKIPLTYMPRALVRLLPFLVHEPGGARLLAFHEFDAERRGLSLRTVEVLGRADASQPVDGTDDGRPLSVASTRRTLLRLREREGMFRDLADIVVDPGGRLVTVSSGNLVMTTSRNDEIERLFAARVAAAERSIEALHREYDRARERFRSP